MGWLQLAGMGMSMFSSYMGNKQQNDDIGAMNAAKREQFEYTKGLTEEMLSDLDQRTNVAEAEAVRASIRTKLGARKAQMVAEGKATVTAAQMGTGSGNRASLALVQGSARQAGDIITDANTNLQTDLHNITQHYNDTASKAIVNLNNAVPSYQAESGTLSMLTSAAGAGVQYWQSMSDGSKEEVKNLFKTTPKITNNTLLDAPAGYGTTEAALIA